MLFLPFIWVFCLQIGDDVLGHGRMMDPPARNSMWRFGFPNPVNYNDNELYCGGYSIQWGQNGGKCGICGDSYDAEKPRPHEAGGLFAKGIVSRRYSVGQEIEIEIELTANHYGYFELFMCPNNNPRQEATQECLKRYPLFISGSRDFRYVIPEDGQKKALFRYSVRLPPYVTCTQCVIQWSYYTGNQWGTCPNGTQAQGCGKSETFRNCADVSITSSAGGSIPPLFVGNNDNPFLLYFRDSSRPSPYNVYPLVIRDQVCVPNTMFRLIPGMDKWCQRNCLSYPPNCPKKVCQCPDTCAAIGKYQGERGADIQCMHDCLVYPSRCRQDECQCYETIEIGRRISEK